MIDRPWGLSPFLRPKKEVNMTRTRLLSLVIGASALAALLANGPWPPN